MSKCLLFKSKSVHLFEFAGVAIIL